MPEAAFRTAPTTRGSSVADIVQHIVQSTVELGMQPGDRLPPERQLGAQLGVGRSALREALKCLDILGFIEIRQGDGTYLSTTANSVLPQVVSWGLLLGTRQAEQLIETRYFIETSLARLAATRRTEDEAKKLAKLVDEMASAATAEDFAYADSTFHLAIADASGNPPLRSILESIKTLLDVWIVRVVSRSEDTQSLINQHRSIANAIREGHPDAAATAMGEHISEVTKRLKQSLD